LNHQEPVSNDHLVQFEFSEDTLNTFRKNKYISVDLYDKDGKLLMPKKRNPTEDDFGKLLRIELQGAYYQASEHNKIKVGQSPESDAKNVKLFDSEKTIEFAKQSASLLNDLRKETFSIEHSARVQKSMNAVLDDFTSNPDFEHGLFNILEILNVAGVPLESELMTKRTIVAMGMKVRTKKIVADEDKKPNKKDHLAIMTASFLADIGYTKLNLSDSPVLAKDEYALIQQHPTLSYLMTLSASDIPTEVRTLVLNHHRPFRGNGLNNNFPDTKQVFNRLMAVRDKFVKDVSKKKIIEDIEAQLRIQESNVSSVNFEEDIAILSLASEYASLTSNQPWRAAFKSATALKVIVNDSFFSYSNKNIRHLLDYVGASLTNNENIINLGDFVITASIDSEKRAHFDICQVVELDRYQTRPKIQRICTIKPIFKRGVKYYIEDFDSSEVKMDRRKAITDLSAQTSSTQRIIYIIDPELNAPLYDVASKLSKSG